MGIVEVKNLSKEYKNKVIALNNVSVEFQEGTFSAIMGPSGSGKSTLLDIIGLLDTQTAGSLYVNGKEIKKEDASSLSLIRRENFGFVFQNFYLNSKLKAIDNVIVPMLVNPEYKNNRKTMKDKARELLYQFGLEERVEHYPSELSGGEQQRVAIARALANNPKIILADEPTGNLDEENENLIFEYLRKLTDKGKTIIAVSHNENIRNYTDGVIYLKKGSLQ